MDSAAAAAEVIVREQPDNNNAATLLRCLRKLVTGREKGNQEFVKQNWEEALEVKIQDQLLSLTIGINEPFFAIVRGRASEAAVRVAPMQ